MTARRHHFISRCYLRGFCSDPAAPRLFVTDFKERKQFDTSPENVALQRDFHTLDDPSQPPDVIEKTLAVFESDLGPALRRISETGSLADSSDRELLFFFMALVTVKNPTMRRRISESIGAVQGLTAKMEAADADYWNAKMATAKAEGTIPEDADTDRLRDLILKDGLKFGLTVPGHMYLEFNLVDKILPCFRDRKWTLLRADPGRTAFITSDNPICLLWQKRGRTDPVGLGNPGTEIIFPVSNEVAIIGTFEGKPCAAPADDELVCVVNGNVLPCAARQVYARSRDFRYLMPHNPEPKDGADLLGDPVSVRDQPE
jgi:hypothetical protein